MRGVDVRSLPPYDRWWIERERCPRCGAKPLITRYVSFEWGCVVDFKCPRCGLEWGAEGT